MDPDNCDHHICTFDDLLFDSGRFHQHVARVDRYNIDDCSVHLECDIRDQKEKKTRQMARIVILVLLLFSCATQYPVMLDRTVTGETYETRVMDVVEERPSVNYYRYVILTQSPAHYYWFEVVTDYPIPVGVKLHLCFDSLEVNEPRRGDIDKVRYMYKSKNRR